MLHSVSQEAALPIGWLLFLGSRPPTPSLTPKPTKASRGPCPAGGHLLLWNLAAANAAAA